MAVGPSNRTSVLDPYLMCPLTYSRFKVIAHSAARLDNLRHRFRSVENRKFLEIVNFSLILGSLPSCLFCAAQAIRCFLCSHSWFVASCYGASRYSTNRLVYIYF